MQINSANMAFLFTAVNTRFKDAFAKYTDSTWQQFASLIPMANGIVELPILDQIARLREWVGPRKINKLSAQKLTIKARKFEGTYEVPMDTIEDDTYGMTATLLEQMGQSAANLPNDLLEEALEGAASAKWLDGGNFFGTSRKYGKNTIANYTTNALSASSLMAAYTAMTSYKGHEDDPLKVRPTVLIHGPALKFTVKALLENEFVSDGTTTVSNATRNLVQPIELPGITGSKWFLAAAGDVIKPLAYFERRRPDTIARMDQPTDSCVFVDDRALYGVKGRADAAFILPHLIYFGNPA